MLEFVRRPGRIGSLVLPHRIVMGSMHLGIEDRDDGGEALGAFYAERARGGAGLIVTGGWAVSRVGAGGPHYGFVNEDAGRQRLAAVAGAVHEAGGRIALQLFHAGRYATRDAFGLRPVAPSAVPSRFSPEPPLALDGDGIAATIANFVSGAAAAREAGFDAVELMGSEGYLLNQFVSPLTNTRDDAWGGDAVRRRAFPLAVLTAVRDAVGPTFPVLYRMSGADLMPGSTTDAETADLAVALVAVGADALNVGVGWHESAVPTVQLLVPGGAWTPYAARIKRAVGDAVVITGNRINRLAQAEEILRAGAADFVSMARPFLADPSVVRSTFAGRAVNICIGCDQACIDRSLVDETVSCLVNPAAVPSALTAARARQPGDPTRRGRVAVLGGGPAGLAAARELAHLGHRVEVFEAEPELGGQFRMAQLVPGKADYGETIAFYAAELAACGVRVHLGRRVTAGDGGLLAGFDAAVLATGVRPRRVGIDGVDAPHVLDYPAAFASAGAPDLGSLGSGSADLGSADLGSVGLGPVGLGSPGHGPVAIVGGGGIAVDLAHLISSGPAAPDPERFRAAHGLVAHGLVAHGLVAHGLVAHGPADGAAGAASGSDPGGVPSPRPAVTVMRRSGRIGAGIGRTTRWALLAELRRHGVAMLTGVRYQRIDADGVWIAAEPGDGGASCGRLIRGSTVVIAAGQVPEASLGGVLDRVGVPFRVAGGARSTEGLDAVRAFAEGVAVAQELSAVLAGGARSHAR